MKKQENKNKGIVIKELLKLILLISPFLMFIISGLMVASMGLGSFMEVPLFFAEVTFWTKIFNLGIWGIVMFYSVDQISERIEMFKKKIKNERR